MTENDKSDAAQEAGGAATLTWDGALTLPRAGTLAEEASAAIAEAAARVGGTLVLDLSAAEGADLAGLQILLAATREAEARGVALRLRAPADGPVAAAAARAGLSLPA